MTVSKMEAWRTCDVFSTRCDNKLSRIRRLRTNPPLASNPPGRADGYMRLSIMYGTEGLAALLLRSMFTSIELTLALTIMP